MGGGSGLDGPDSSSQFAACPNEKSGSGFSLVEILVVMALLTFIIIGLLLMFSQTQRAFKMSMTQTDMLETGRSFTDIMARQLGQMTPCGANSNVNFYVAYDDSFSLIQPLPGTTVPRTNVVDQVFFLNYSPRTVTNEWTGIGYVVVPDTNGSIPNPPNPGVGTLYQFTASASAYQAGLLYTQFNSTISSATVNSNWHRIADGIVHLRVRAFATNGYPIYGTNPYPMNVWFRTNGLNNASWGVLNLPNTVVLPDTTAPDDMRWYFFHSNAVPASVELELGVLESQALERFNALPPSPTGALQRQFLSNYVAQVHLFHQRIPIRAVDPTVY